MHYLAKFRKFDRPGDSENVWDDRCEEGLEDQPIVQLGAWRLYHAECLHLVHLEIIYDSLHSLDPNNPEKEASWRTKNFALDHPKLTNKFIGQNFAPLQQYWDKSHHITAESQTAPNLLVFLSQPRTGTPCPVHPSCFTIPIHLIFFDK